MYLLKDISLNLVLRIKKRYNPDVKEDLPYILDSVTLLGNDVYHSEEVRSRLFSLPFWERAFEFRLSLKKGRFCLFICVNFFLVRDNKYVLT